MRIRKVFIIHITYLIFCILSVEYRFLFSFLEKKEVYISKSRFSGVIFLFLRVILSSRLGWTHAILILRRFFLKKTKLELERKDSSPMEFLRVYPPRGTIEGTSDKVVLHRSDFFLNNIRRMPYRIIIEMERAEDYTRESIPRVPRDFCGRNRHRE